MAHGNTRHGLAAGNPTDPRRHPMYNRWVNMRQRCRNPNNPRYADWGGRGIWFHPLWDDFAVFLQMVGEPPGRRYDLYSLDRIDNDGPYAPGNVRWSTAAQQRANQYRQPWPFGVLANQKDQYLSELDGRTDDEAWDDYLNERAQRPPDLLYG